MEEQEAKRGDVNPNLPDANSSSFRNATLTVWDLHSLLLKQGKQGLLWTKGRRQKQPGCGSVWKPSSNALLGERPWRTHPSETAHRAADINCARQWLPLFLICGGLGGVWPFPALKTGSVGLKESDNPITSPAGLVQGWMTTQSLVTNSDGFKSAQWEWETGRGKLPRLPTVGVTHVPVLTSTP